MWKTWPSGLSNDKNLGLRPRFLSTESLGPCFSHGMGDHDQILHRIMRHWWLEWQFQNTWLVCNTMKHKALMWWHLCHQCSNIKPAFTVGISTLIRKCLYIKHWPLGYGSFHYAMLHSTRDNYLKQCWSPRPPPVADFCSHDNFQTTFLISFIFGKIKVLTYWLPD